MLLGVAGCEKDSPVVKSGLSGEWKLVSWNNTTPQAFDIYMEFFSDGKFNLYQKLATSTYRHLTFTLSYLLANLEKKAQCGFGKIPQCSNFGRFLSPIYKLNKLIDEEIH